MNATETPDWATTLANACGKLASTPPVSGNAKGLPICLARLSTSVSVMSLALVDVSLGDESLLIGAPYVSRPITSTEELPGYMLASVAEVPPTFGFQTTWMFAPV